ncbi:MAG: VCBS repeat-containing protein [Lachnospiraceae bacterium]|nr:VCBS repeat-containing protein [Lachnospiraceae bacterium]
MIIGSSQLAMQSSRAYSQKSASLQVAGWAGRGRAGSEPAAGGKEMFRSFINAGINDWSGIRMLESEAEQLSQTEQLRMKILNEFLARIHSLFFNMREERATWEGGSSSGNYVVQNSYYYEETEQTEYKAEGRVVTADGREIEFGIGLSMSRSFASYCEERYEFNPLPALCDPLVINLDGNVTEVSDKHVRFDLDADGIEDEIARLGSGSAYLALDQNGDGRINDGSELFGTKSGDGFADLAAYDSDGNGWIDEADPVFSRLKLWITEEDGTERLCTLKDMGIGALCLANADTEFSLKKPQDNTTQAMIRKTGVFLYENGMPGSMAHLDLAIHRTAVR